MAFVSHKNWSLWVSECVGFNVSLDIIGYFGEEDINMKYI